MESVCREQVTVSRFLAHISGKCGWTGSYVPIVPGDPLGVEREEFTVEPDFMGDLHAAVLHVHTRSKLSSGKGRLSACPQHKWTCSVSPMRAVSRAPAHR